LFSTDWERTKTLTHFIQDTDVYNCKHAGPKIRAYICETWPRVHETL